MSADAEATRRGRPPRTSIRELEIIALRLFSKQGYDNTTVEDIAAAADISTRTFFRYFNNKYDILWNEHEGEVIRLRAAFKKVDSSLPVLDAIRHVVVSVKVYQAKDVPEARTRMNLIATVPALQASSGSRNQEWERAVAEYVGARLGEPPESLIPVMIARTTQTACLVASEEWLARGDADLTQYLDQALRLLATGFGLTAPAEPPDSVRHPEASYFSWPVPDLDEFHSPGFAPLPPRPQEQQPTAPGSDETEWLTVSAAAALMDVTPKTIATWLEEGLLPHTCVESRPRRYSLADLETLRSSWVPTVRGGVDYAATRKKLYNPRRSGPG